HRFPPFRGTYDHFSVRSLTSPFTPVQGKMHARALPSRRGCSQQSLRVLRQELWRCRLILRAPRGPYSHARRRQPAATGLTGRSRWLPTRWGGLGCSEEEVGKCGRSCCVAARTRRVPFTTPPLCCMGATRCWLFAWLCAPSWDMIRYIDAH